MVLDGYFDFFCFVVFLPTKTTLFVCTRHNSFHVDLSSWSPSLITGAELRSHHPTETSETASRQDPRPRGGSEQHETRQPAGAGLQPGQQ